MRIWPEFRHDCKSIMQREIVFYIVFSRAYDSLKLPQRRRFVGSAKRNVTASFDEAKYLFLFWNFLSSGIEIYIYIGATELGPRRVNSFIKWKGFSNRKETLAQYICSGMEASGVRGESFNSIWTIFQLIENCSTFRWHECNRNGIIGVRNEPKCLQLLNILTTESRCGEFAPRSAD